MLVPKLGVSMVEVHPRFRFVALNSLRNLNIINKRCFEYHLQVKRCAVAEFGMIPSAGLKEAVAVYYVIVSID